MDQPVFHGHNRPRLEGVEARKIVAVGSIFGAKLIEIIVGKERPVGSLL
jgi:hypothetical protein